MEGDSPRSFIGLYWRIWFGLVVCLILIRLVLFFVGVKDEGHLFLVFILYAMPTWLGVMVIGSIEGNRLIGYLERHHNQKWQELTYFPGLGPGHVNSFRSLPFLLSDDDLGDANVRLLKLNCRRFFWLTFTVFFTMPVLFLMTS